VARTYVVDAYNALFRLEDGPPGDRDAARGLLVRRARAALRGRGARVHLVFDASPGSTRSGVSGKDGPVSWQYAEGSADDAIVEWIRRPHLPADDVVVVTDDRELRGRAKQMGAKAVRVAAFFAGRDEEEDRPPPGGPAPGRPRAKDFRPSDFGLGEGPIDLGRADPNRL
jgi:hypothetical protein